MANREMNGLLRSLRRAALRHDGGGLTDGQLLECFLRAQEAAAFEELVRRHGPMVLGVCRRVLNNAHDAEDAFQATFLVMVRKASSIVARETVGNWLYGVAFRTAQKARAAAARRRTKEKQMARPEAIQEDVWREVRPLLDRELNGLPDKYRAPVVLCDIEGHTRKDAAKQLGCPEGTLSARLSRARVLLAKRLARYGLVLSGGAVAVTLSHNAATAALPAPLVSSTVQSAALVAAGHAAAGALPASVAALTEGVLQAMFRTKLKIAAGTALAVAMLGVGFGVYQTRVVAQAPPGAGAAPATAAPVPAKGDEKPADAKEEEKINLPKGAAPTQVLASLDKDGKLVVKSAVMMFRGGPPLPLPAPPGGLPGARGGAGGGGAGGGGGAAGAAGQAGGGGFGGGGGGAAGAAAQAGGGFGGGAAGAAGQARGGFGGGGGFGAPARANLVTTLHTQTYDLDDVQVLDTKGKKVDKKDLPKLLKEEKVAMASLWGQPVDPLHLRVLKDDILTFVLPMPQPGVRPGLPGIALPGAPVTTTVPLPPGGGVVPPGLVPPAAVPPLPPKPVPPAPGSNGDS